jgi:hypothetical protein
VQSWSSNRPATRESKRRRLYRASEGTQEALPTRQSTRFCRLHTPPCTARRSRQKKHAAAPPPPLQFFTSILLVRFFVGTVVCQSIIGPGAGHAAVEVIVRPRHHAAQSEARDVDCDLQPAPQLQDGMVDHEVSCSRTCVCARKREICVGVLNSKRDRVGEDESVCG